MQYRVGGFLLFTFAVALIVQRAGSMESYMEVYASMPGGADAVPGFTRLMHGLSTWVGRWWWLLIGLGGVAFFGTPYVLRRSEGGRALAAKLDKFMQNYHFVVMCIYVIFIFQLLWAMDHAAKSPFLQVIDSLTGD